MDYGKRKSYHDNDYNDDYEWGEEKSNPYKEIYKRRKLLDTSINHPLIYTVNNEVHFTAGVDKDTIEEVIKQISMIISQNKKKYEGTNDTLDITYIVDSPGGSVVSILKFVDFIYTAKKKYPFVRFISVITGLVASAGTIMCVIADKRLMMPHAHAMIHELSAGNSGKYTHLLSHNDFLKQLHEDLVDIYLKGRCKKTKEELERLLKDETWYNSTDYMKAGFVDEIM
jgi:ATP-dependent protease ClpP protease subunit